VPALHDQWHRIDAADLPETEVHILERDRFPLLLIRIQIPDFESRWKHSHSLRSDPGIRLQRLEVQLGSGLRIISRLKLFQ
jgi:hypothetical protein